MTETDRIWDFLQRLTPLSRSCLLRELERLELSGVDMPGSSDIQARLRAEFRKDGAASARAGDPSRHFFAPVEPLLVDTTPAHANTARICRGTLTPIWEWICRDLLPTMARDYVKSIDGQAAAGRASEVKKTAAVFQTKVVKVVENTLAAPDGAELARGKLAQYTAAPAAFDEVIKILHVLRNRDALAKFGESLPAKITKLDDAQTAAIMARLDSLRKTNAEAVPFALALVAGRLKTPWELIRLATGPAASKSAADVAATPYAMAVSLVLDQIEDKRLALRFALRRERVLVARDLLADIYDTEYAIKAHIDGIEQSDWGIRLQRSMDATAALVATEVSRFPGNVGHILGSRRLRRAPSFTGRLVDLAWKGRDAVQDGAAVFRKLIAQT